jgi:hypothetical protein
MAVTRGTISDFMALPKLAGKLFGKRLIWSIALYAVDGGFVPGSSLGAPFMVFDTKRIDLSGASPHTRVDPFLFVHGDRFYIFYELVSRGGRGQIAAIRTSDLKQFEDLGVVLRAPFHLSFPFVFQDRSSIYMLPESECGDELALYGFDAFPFGAKKVRVLLQGLYADSHLLKHMNRWFLFTTRGDEFCVYVAEDLLTGEFSPHPTNPITWDPKISRSAGATIRLEGHLYRVAQDCSDTYGKNVSLIEITELSPVAYRERVAVKELFALDASWKSEGAHHLSICRFLRKTILATDGKQVDYFANRISALWRRPTNSG